jgi:D-alanyl-D-alanine carboxypeptidase
VVNFENVFERLDELIEQDINLVNAPGIAVGLTNRDQLLRVRGYGTSNVDKQNPVQLETLFEIGSISKAFTSIAILQLQEQGLLNVHDPVTKHLPWFEIQSQFDPITLHHLMSHSAGIIMGADVTPSDYLETWNLRHTEVGASPGMKFQYSNIGYKVLGLVLQEILRQDISEILRERVLDPLGMKDTESVITHDTRARLAVGYEAFYDDRPLPRGGPLAPATWLEFDAADGSICTTAADMCIYLRALLCRGQGILEEPSFEQLIRPIIPTADGLHGEYYGYGLFIEEIEGHQAIGHSGGMVGYTANLLADVDAGLGVVVLTNGPAEPEGIVRYALGSLRAAQEERQLPPLPVNDPRKIDNANDYAGTYHSRDKAFRLLLQGDQLCLEFKGDTTPLESRAPHGFYVPQPAFERFLLHFGSEDGKIVEALHGPDWYIRNNELISNHLTHPLEWEAYPGHYRSYNPWLSNFRVVLRKGLLVLIYPSGIEEHLVPLRKGVFRVGEDSHSPERLSFDVVLKGQAMQANLSGGVYCRTFTP